MRNAGRGGVVHVVDGAAVRTAAPAREAAGDLGVIDVQQHHGVERLTDAGQHYRKCVGLGKIAREPIEHVAAGDIRLTEPLADDTDDDLVHHQRAGVHGRLRPEPQGRAASHGRAQQVAGGNLRDPETHHQPLRLGAFARTGRAE